MGKRDDRAKEAKLRAEVAELLPMAQQAKEKAEQQAGTAERYGCSAARVAAYVRHHAGRSGEALTVAVLARDAGFYHKARWAAKHCLQHAAAAAKMQQAALRQSQLMRGKNLRVATKQRVLDLFKEGLDLSIKADRCKYRPLKVKEVAGGGKDN